MSATDWLDMATYVGVIDEVNHTQLFMRNHQQAFYWLHKRPPTEVLPKKNQTVRLSLNDAGLVTRWEPFDEQELIDKLEAYVARPLAPAAREHSPDVRVKCLQVAAELARISNSQPHTLMVLDIAQALEDWCYR